MPNILGYRIKQHNTVVKRFKINECTYISQMNSKQKFQEIMNEYSHFNRYRYNKKIFLSHLSISLSTIQSNKIETTTAHVP